MSSSSWRQYGGRSIVVKDTINVGTVIADKFLTRKASSITDTFENVNILGELIVGYDSTIGRRLFVLNDQYNYSNLYLKNKLFFGTTSLSVDPNYAYITGGQYNIGINTTTPSTVFHITGYDPTVSNILTIDTQSPTIRNIIGQNVNKKGLVITANDTNSNILFYNDSKTDVITPDAFIRYSIGKNLTLNTQNTINLTSNNIILQFNAGSANFNQTDININTPGNITSTSKSKIFYNYKKDASNSSIKIDASGVTLNTTDNVFMYSNNNIFLNTILTEISSNLVVSRNGIYNNIYGETTTIYDSSNSYYLTNIYDNSFSTTGNALTLVAVDTSSNTTARIVAPNNIGLSLQGGVFVNDTSRSFASISLSDISQNNILSQTILSGKDQVKYYSTTGINTYSPKTENYVLDINGPTRIGNGEINITSIPNFEITLMKFSKTNPMSGIAVGTPTTIFGNNNNYTYNQFIIYTKNGGITWNTSNIAGLSSVSNNNFISLYVYNENFSIIGTVQSNLFYTNDGGVNWYSIFYKNYADPSTYRTINSIVVRKDTNNYNITTTFSKNGLYYYNNFSIPIANIGNIDIPTDDNIITNTINISTGDVGKNNPTYLYFVGNGIFQYNIVNTTILQIDGNNNYNSIYVIDDNNYVAVGNNIIFTKTNTSTKYNIISGNLRSVYLYDLLIGIAVGDNGLIYYSNNWSLQGSWNIVPFELLNSSGIANRIKGKNLTGISMRDINTFIISSTINPYIESIQQRGKSQIMLCFFPNLFNRKNNKVFDVSGNMFISGDININDGDLSVLDTSSRTNGIFSRIFDNNNVNKSKYDNTLIYNKDDIDDSIYIGINSTNINIGSYGLYGNGIAKTAVSFGKKKFTLGSGKFQRYGDETLSTTGDTFFIGGAGDFVYINGKTRYLSRNNIEYKSPMLTLNYNNVISSTISDGVVTSINEPTGATYTNDGKINSAVGIGIADGPDVSAGYIFISASSTGYIFKTPKSLNVVNLNIGSLTLPDGRPPKQTTSNILNDISNGILVLTRDYDTSDKANYAITVKPIDISNIFLRDNTSLANYQQILTNVGVSGDLTVMLNNRLMVYSDVSFNSRLYVYNDVSFNTRLFVGGDVSLNSRLTVYNDVSFNTRLFVGGDVSLNANLYVANISTLKGPIYQF
jgi:hypothetical protein